MFLFFFYQLVHLYSNLQMEPQAANVSTECCISHGWLMHYAPCIKLLLFVLIELISSHNTVQGECFGLCRHIMQTYHVHATLRLKWHSSKRKMSCEWWLCSIYCKVNASAADFHMYTCLFVPQMNMFCTTGLTWVFFAIKQLTKAPAPWHCQTVPPPLHHRSPGFDG